MRSCQALPSYIVNSPYVAFGATTPTAALAFQSTGAAFGIGGVPIARDAALVEAGGDLQLTVQAKVGASHAGQLANRAHDHSRIARSWSTRGEGCLLMCVPFRLVGC